MEEIRFFLEYGNKVMQLPVNPEALTVKTDGNNSTAEIVKLGEVNLLGNVKLTEISIESFFPAHSDYPWVLTKGKFEGPKAYIDHINKARKDKKPLRLVVSGANINMLMGVESFEYSYVAQGDDISYTLSLKEYREYMARTVTLQVEQKKTAPARANTSKEVTIGCTVIVNGRLHRDSYGAGPGLTEKNAKRKVNYIQKGRKYPYHVTTMDGGWRGWVTADSVKVV